MNIKTDTKERFTVITVLETALTENMAENCEKTLLACLKTDTPQLVLNLSRVRQIDAVVANAIASCQQKFYDSGCSFVI